MLQALGSGHQAPCSVGIQLVAHHMAKASDAMWAAGRAQQCSSGQQSQQQQGQQAQRQPQGRKPVAQAGEGCSSCARKVSGKVLACGPCSPLTPSPSCLPLAAARRSCCRRCSPAGPAAAECGCRGRATAAAVAIRWQRSKDEPQQRCSTSSIGISIRSRAPAAVPAASVQLKAHVAASIS